MAARITWCGNVHAAEDLEAWLAGIARFAVPISGGERLGLGAWWNAAIAARLATEATARERVRAALAAAGLTVWTLNAFPFGGFHAEVVKEQVYRPDWSREDRLQYTKDAATAVAELLGGAGASEPVPVSTLPVGHGEVDLRLAARNLARAASHLAALEQRTGVHVVLALEPEPFCVLETVRDAIAFFERWLLLPGAWTVPEDVLRRHLGVCVDLCHLAVVGEDALAARAQLAAHGIADAKIQVSAGLELRDGAALERLLAFDEPRWLHQAVAAGGARALDLDGVRADRARFAAGAPVRAHFHVPVFWDEPGPLGSTRAELERVLRGWPRPLPLLEVETYTWGVLPPGLAAPDLTVAIRRELDFVRKLVET
jgi:sugar phosphate isomerase/epimerase